MSSYPRNSRKASVQVIGSTSRNSKEDVSSTQPLSAFALKSPSKRISPGADSMNTSKKRSPRSVIIRNNSGMNNYITSSYRSSYKLQADSLQKIRRPEQECMRLKMQLISIASYINQGCDAFHSRQYNLAMRLFQDAHNSLKNHRNEVSSPSASERFDLVHGRQFDNDDFTTSNSYIYQRIEFDEGMCTYSSPMDVDISEVKTETIAADDIHHASRMKIRLEKAMNEMEALIWYNKGHLYRHHQLWDEAMQCLNNSLELVSCRLAKSRKDDESRSDRATGRSPASIRIATMQTIGQIQYRLGNYEEAIISYKNSVNYAKRVHRSLNLPSIASALNSLGVIYYHLASTGGENSESNESHLTNAKKTSLQALKIRIEVLEEDHLDVATSYNNIGRLYIMDDGFSEAIECYEKALQIREDKLGKDSLDYAATAFNAGQSYHHIHDLDKALFRYQEFLDVAIRHYTKNHRDVAVVLSGKAEIYQERGEFDKALKLYEESLESAKNALGEEHEEIAMILNRLGHFHYVTGNYNAAHEVYSSGLKIESQVLGAKNPNRLVSLCNLGEIHRQRKEWDAAIKIFKEVLDIQRNQFGLDAQNAEIAITLHVLGLTYEKKGSTENALKHLQDALWMRRVVLGDDHLDLTPTLTSIGIIFSRGNKLNLAIDLLGESLRIRKANLGENNRDVAFTLYNIALVHQKQGLLLETVFCLLKVLSIEISVLGPEHKDVAITMFKLGETFERYNDPENALKYFKQALEVEQKVLQEEDPLTIARTLSAIGNIYLSQGNVVPMMEAFIEAGRIYQASDMNPSNVSVNRNMYAFHISCPLGAPAA